MQRRNSLYCFQAVNLNSIKHFRFTNYYGKGNKKCIAQRNIIGHRLFASEPMGNFFYLHAATFEIPK